MAHSAAVTAQIQSAQALLGASCRGSLRKPGLRSLCYLLSPFGRGRYVCPRKQDFAENTRQESLALWGSREATSVGTFSSSRKATRVGTFSATRLGAFASRGVTMAAVNDKKREIMVQHILVKEDNEKLLTELQQRILLNGDDLGTLATEYSECPSKEQGGMLGWVKKGSLVPEFENAAFEAPLNKPVKVKTKFGWHLLQVLNEREPNEVLAIPVEELHARLKEGLSDDVQLMDVREPDEVAKASLPGFKVYPLSKFGEWAPTLDLDPKKETIVLCHHGMRSLQASTWLVQQGFKTVKNVVGGIDYYSKTADPSIPQY